MARKHTSWVTTTAHTRGTWRSWQTDPMGTVCDGCQQVMRQSVFCCVDRGVQTCRRYGRVGWLESKALSIWYPVELEGLHRICARRREYTTPVINLVNDKLSCRWLQRPLSAILPIV